MLSSNRIVLSYLLLFFGELLQGIAQVRVRKRGMAIIIDQFKKKDRKVGKKGSSFFRVVYPCSYESYFDSSERNA